LPITWNLPEYFEKPQGGGMDLAAIAKHATPGLIDEIAQRYPSFPQQWVDDRTRTLAALFLLEQKHPDVLAVHLVDVDAEEHETGPFSPASNALLEYTDELIGRILGAVPEDTVLALVSDPGFVPVERTVHPPLGTVSPFWVTAATASDADELLRLREDPANGIGRQIPTDEWRRFEPGQPTPAAAFEPLDRFAFSLAPLATRYGKPHEIGTHGLWPGRPEYRSVFLLWVRESAPSVFPRFRSCTFTRTFTRSFSRSDAGVRVRLCIVNTDTNENVDLAGPCNGRILACCSPSRI
jgi:hypothetical protein